MVSAPASTSQTNAYPTVACWLAQSVRTWRDGVGMPETTTFRSSSVTGHPIDWSNLREDYERLGSGHAVAEAYNCTYTAVMKALKRMGIPRHPRFPYRWDDLEAEIARLGSVKAVAKARGCASSSVDSQVRKRGIRYMPSLEKTGGSCAAGRRAELLALQILPDALDLNVRTFHARSDLMWRGCLVDVKSAKLCPGRAGGCWQFQLNDKRDHSHLFLCLGFDASGRSLLAAYLIPGWAVLVKGTMRIPMGRWSHFHRYALPIPEGIEHA